MRKIFEFLDQRSAFQRIVLMWLMWLTTWAAFWCTDFATAKIYPDALQVAAVIASVMAPITALQGAVFKWYSDTK